MFCNFYTYVKKSLRFPALKTYGPRWTVSGGAAASNRRYVVGREDVIYAATRDLMDDNVRRGVD